ncbi:TIM barrel protein [soil metagenome]
MKPHLLLTLCALFFGVMVRGTTAAEIPENFQRANLVPWCIVPFDAAKRGPEARAAMLAGLGLQRSAYDWRAEHVPTFAEEIAAYRKHGIEFFAFWAQEESAFALFEEHGLAPQIWVTCPDPGGTDAAARVGAAADALEPAAKRAEELGSSLGLYNHGGWGGEPENLVAVTKALHARGFSKVGIVYNFHHGHDRIGHFKEDLALMDGHLLCVNLNGMVPGGDPKILTLGEGSEEAGMIRTLIETNYAGPVGIIDHREDLDTELALRENLEGLSKILSELGFEGK